MAIIRNPSRTIEYWLASVTICWGAWLLGAWDTFGTTPAFRVIIHIAPEWAWGAALVLFGALFQVGTWRANLVLRRRSLMLLCLLWLAIWIGLVLGNWRGTSTIIYIHLSILSGMLYLRTKKNGER